ncbi:single-stranded DNA-binding protein, partial [Staphylococcus aureus]
NSYNAPQNNQQHNNPFENANGPIEINDDDLPF